MKISVILGTRPEIIKMSPVIRELQRQAFDFLTIHTGQHYSYKLDQVFLEELNLPEPEYQLEIGSGTHGEQTGMMLQRIEQILLRVRPDLILVEGDTNSVLAGALAAAKLHIKVGHVEAGLRSYDRNMPEEINRIVTDHLSDLLFAPTKTSRDTLLVEGLPLEKIFITGNTIVDAVYQNLEIALKESQILNSLGLNEREYFLATIHREENVDNMERLKDILACLQLMNQRYDLPLIYPIHPRTRRRIEEFRLKVPSGVKPIEPLGLLDFLTLEAHAALVLTDSGGVQEETCILKVPCITLRDSTERPETLKVGSNSLNGTKRETILGVAESMISKERNWENPFGDGNAAIKIVRTIRDEIFHE